MPRCVACIFYDDVERPVDLSKFMQIVTRRRILLDRGAVVHLDVRKVVDVEADDPSFREVRSPHRQGRRDAGAKPDFKKGHWGIPQMTESAMIVPRVCVLSVRNSSFVCPVLVAQPREFIPIKCAEYETTKPRSQGDT